MAGAQQKEHYLQVCSGLILGEVSYRCLKNVWRVFEWSLLGVLNFSEEYLEGAWRVSGRKIFGPPICLVVNFSGPWIYQTQKLFGPKTFSSTIFFKLRFFFTKNCYIQCIYFSLNTLGSKVLDWNITWLGIMISTSAYSFLAIKFYHIFFSMQLRLNCTWEGSLTLALAQLVFYMWMCSFYVLEGLFVRHKAWRPDLLEMSPGGVGVKVWQGVGCGYEQ